MDDSPLKLHRPAPEDNLVEQLWDATQHQALRELVERLSKEAWNERNATWVNLESARDALSKAECQFNKANKRYHELCAAIQIIFKKPEGQENCE